MSRAWWFYSGWLGGVFFTTAGIILISEWRRKQRTRLNDGCQPQENES